MGRISAVLDEEVDYGFEGGPEYSTGVVDLENRFEERDSAWQFARHQYNASFKNLDDPDRDRMIEVFHACRGRRHSFGFKDWNDYQAIEEPLNVNAGTSEKIQLYKTYDFGEAFTTRPIQRVKEATIYNSIDVAVAGFLDLLTGEFTPTNPWAVGQHYWTGEFYVWVRFDADYNPMTINSWRANTATVDLIEDPLEITATNVPPSWEE